MEAIGLIIVILLFFVGIPFIIGRLIYIIPKRLGYTRTAKWAIWIYITLIGLVILATTFEDELFTKNDARKFAKELDISLTDDFRLIQNESMSGIGDYYHTFSLSVSKNEKERLIQSIKSDENFLQLGKKVVDFRFDSNIDKDKGNKAIQNYETEDAFVKELFKPNGQGYAPTFYRATIYKKGTVIVFEDIDD